MTKTTDLNKPFNVSDLTETDIELLNHAVKVLESTTLFAGDHSDKGGILINKIIAAIKNKELHSITHESYTDPLFGEMNSTQYHYFDPETIAKIQLREAISLPRVDVEMVGDLLELINKEYNYPVNPANNRRIGWETARRYLNTKLDAYFKTKGK